MAEKTLQHGRCGAGESVFDVEQRMRAKGLISKTAHVDGLTRYQYGDENKNHKIVGYVTVRANEMFSILEQ